jgi:hypothetical protein
MKMVRACDKRITELQKESDKLIGDAKDAMPRWGSYNSN